MTWIYLTLLFTNVDAISPGVPNRQPQLAAAHGIVAMTFAAGPSIYFASSSDQGATFSRPVKVADAKILAVGRHRGPRIAILKDAIVITAVVGEALATGEHAHGLPADGDLVTSRHGCCASSKSLREDSSRHLVVQWHIPTR